MIRAVLVEAVVDECEPGAGDGEGGAAAEHAGSAVDAAGPVGLREVLILAQLWGPVEQHADALGTLAELVRVAGDGGHARHAEVEAWLVQEGQHEAARAAVHVQVGAPLQRHTRQALDVVHHAVAVGRRAGPDLNKPFTQMVFLSMLRLTTAAVSLKDTGSGITSITAISMILAAL